MWGKIINYSCVVLFPWLSTGRRERLEVTEKQGGDRKKRWIRGEKSNAEKYFIKVAFITTAFMWCLFSCHSSISPSSPSLSLFFLSAFLNASSLSLSLSATFQFPLRPSLTFCVPLSCDLFSTSPYLSLSLDCCVKDCSGLLSGRK